MNYSEISKMIDHSLLQPNLTEEEIVNGCNIALKYDVAAAMVRPSDTRLAYDILKGSNVMVASSVGFPHGVNLTRLKVVEASFAISNGAKELDMVLNIGQLKSKNYDYVKKDIESVVDVANGLTVKVILENSYLTDEEKVIACKIVEQSGAHFVKTASGYAPGGATIEDVILMKASVSKNIKIKAAGGIRTLDSMIDYVNAGATRFGATATKIILDEYCLRNNLPKIK